LVKSVGECTISSLAVLDKLDGAFAWKGEKQLILKLDSMIPKQI
jgi:hypothetical protein